MDSITPGIGTKKSRSLKKMYGIEWEQFKKAIINPTTVMDVQVEMDRSFSRTNGGARHRVVVHTPTVTQQPASNRGGVLYPVSSAHNQIVSSESFPEYLVEEGLSPEEALKLAATSVIAYTSLHYWTEHLASTDRVDMLRLTRKPSMDYSYPNLWPLEARSGVGNYTLPAAVHRTAARIALNVSGISDFDPSMKPPLPYHIAALADPFSNEQVALLHDIVVV